VRRQREDVVLRDARPEELPEIDELTLAAYAEYGSVMRPSAWKGLSGAVRAALEGPGDSQRIVATRNERIVGSVMLFPPSGELYEGRVGGADAPELRLLAVHSDARGAGIGRRLVEECIRRARDMGAPALGLHTSESMWAAIRLYRSMGFERDPDRDFQPEGAELVEAYRLPLQ
jgi:ribosomal protein S18 acetylase RimI-like enzyme